MPASEREKEVLVTCTVHPGLRFVSTLIFSLRENASATVRATTAHIETCEMAQAASSTGDLYAVADFCLIPMGLADPSVAEYIAECQRVLEKTGLKFKVSMSEGRVAARGYGTNLEGPWTEVTQAIQACHAAVHAKGAPRIATDVRIGTRVDREVAPGTGNEGKVKRVEGILAQDSGAQS
ncbi:hypothetical protein C2E23DRAFT_903497 [Lenzites betulinus]|nr:hypothetical protein C2E23DRAFT_903497 [Lenzites betulinus]